MSWIAGAVLLMAATGSSAYTAPSIPLACTGAGSATCQTIAASGVATNSDNIAAQAVFEVSGTTLFVTLSNTSLFDVTSNPSVLTALMFNLKYTNGDAVALDPVKALIKNFSSGTSVTFNADTIYGASGPPNDLESTCAGTVSDPATCNAASNDVGGEWEYNTISHKGFTQGISSTGLGLFGSGTMFGLTNLSGPAGVDGPQYGITTKSDNQTTGNLSGPLTQDTVQFKLDITNFGSHTLALNTAGALSAGFQYGTNLNDTFLPIPGTLPLLAFGLLLLGWGVRRRAVQS